MVLAIIAALLVILVSVVTLRTVSLAGRKSSVPFSPEFRKNMAAAEKLSGAIRFRTESFGEISRIDLSEYHRFHRYLEESFPLVHGRLERTALSDYAVLYTWRGRRPGKKPVMLMGHWDVVPVSPEDEPLWSVPPFSGKIADGFIHGRGSLDDKLTVISILEAAENLLAEGFSPERTVYFAFGGDEEVGGLKGAAVTAAYLEKQGIRLAWVLDEASPVIEGGILGIQRPIAMIAPAEKGHADISVTATGPEGHASMPPKTTAAGILAGAIRRIEKKQPPLKMIPLLRRFLETLAPNTSIGLRIILANLWLTKPVVLRVLQAAPSSNSLARTTRAVTMLQGSPAENVLPRQARAIVNCRILPGSTVQETLERLRQVTGGKNIEVALHRGEDSGEPVGSGRGAESEGFTTLAETLAEVLPGVVPAPFLFNATTDSRHFAGISDVTLRFMPVVLRNEDLQLFHGANERVSIANLSRYVEFLVHLIRKA